MCEYVRYFFHYSKYNIYENINKDKKQGCAPIKLIKSVIKPMVTCEIIFFKFILKNILFSESNGINVRITFLRTFAFFGIYWYIPKLTR